MDELTNMKEKKKRRMSKKDWVLIVVILCVAGLAFLLHEVIGAEGAGSVTVKVNGKIEGVYSLAEDREIKWRVQHSCNQESRGGYGGCKLPG